jgi:hypothetical protein
MSGPVHALVAGVQAVEHRRHRLQQRIISSASSSGCNVSRDDRRHLIALGGVYGSESRVAPAYHSNAGETEDESHDDGGGWHRGGAPERDRQRGTDQLGAGRYMTFSIVTSPARLIGVRHLLSSLAGVVLMASIGHDASAGESPSLRLISKISLGDVRGRIDHLAVDLGRRRLFVAELGNDTVGVVDLKGKRTQRTIAGLREPQGIGYVPSMDSVYVANGADGSLRIFRGPDLVPSGEIALGDDADNVRVDDAAHRLFVGYGSGALAVIDTTRATRVATIALEAHPESFRLEPTGNRIIVNVPNAGEIAVVDRRREKTVASWRTGALRANFPLALDETHGRLITVFRHPPKLGIYRARDGRLVAALDTCGDSDDVFVDSRRSRIYVICGEGAIDVFGAVGERYGHLARIRTAPGARTGLFVPELDRLFLAVRARSGTPAAIWVYGTRR